VYSRQLLDHFENPRGVGDLDEATVSVELQNPACGDILRLSLRIENERVVEARFRAKGCVPAIACGSKLVEAIRGADLATARALKEEVLVEALGGLPQASRHAGALAIDTLRAALNRL